jgi:hypothetical protein
MNYSKSHQNFNNHFGGDNAAIAQPESLMGPNYKTVLNFWSWLDSNKNQ